MGRLSTQACRSSPRAGFSTPTSSSATTPVSTVRGTLLASASASPAPADRRLRGAGRPSSGMSSASAPGKRSGGWADPGTSATLLRQAPGSGGVTVDQLPAGDDWVRTDPARGPGCSREYVWRGTLVVRSLSADLEHVPPCAQVLPGPGGRRVFVTAKTSILPDQSHLGSMFEPRGALPVVAIESLRCLRRDLPSVPARHSDRPTHPTTSQRAP